MYNAVQKPCELVQFADDLFLCVSNQYLNTAFSQLETNAANFFD